MEGQLRRIKLPHALLEKFFPRKAEMPQRRLIHIQHRERFPVQYPHRHRVFPEKSQMRLAADFHDCQEAMVPMCFQIQQTAVDKTRSGILGNCPSSLLTTPAEISPNLNFNLPSSLPELNSIWTLLFLWVKTAHGPFPSILLKISFPTEVTEDREEGRKGGIYPKVLKHTSVRVHF